jgi:hypothetical protein
MGGSRRLRAAVSGVAVLVALCAASCGGSTGARASASSGPPSTTAVEQSPSPALQARLLRSVARTSAERSARTAISVTLTGLGNDALSNGAFDIAGTGVVDFSNGDADLRVTIPRFDRAGAGGAIEQRIVGGVVYSRFPAPILRAAGLPAGVDWLSLDPARIGGADPSAVSQAQADPAGQLAFLAATSNQVRVIGSDPVRGVPATHYTTTIDLGAGVGSRKALAAVRARLAPLGFAAGRRPLVVDVWLDATGCARRVVVSIPLSAAAAPGGLAGLGPDAMLRIQGDFYGFGATAKVAVPPPSRVRPYSLLRLDALQG